MTTWWLTFICGIKECLDEESHSVWRKPHLDWSQGVDWQLAPKIDTVSPRWVAVCDMHVVYVDVTAIVQ